MCRSARSDLWTYAFLAQIHGDRPAYEQTVAEATAAADATNDVSARAYTLLVRGYDALIGNRMPEAATLFEESAALHRGEGDLGGQLWAQYNYGMSTALAGELGRGRDVLHHCVDELAARGKNPLAVVALDLSGEPARPLHVPAAQ
ncbi:hypothetical protein [Amycolatopsis australiensis]|uniref:hypothetical protein n=1 Tax=Amycolatopsis australiensis TaxID=546364 RepID=UPI0009307E20|nr:hypothetical protein [Amycolatopsis australiensis]